MSRNEPLEKILEARFEFDYAPTHEKDRCLKRLYELIDQAISGKDISRHELLTSIHDRYLEYKKQRRRKEKISVAQRLRS